MARCAGIVTNEGDCPGLNAAIRGFGQRRLDRFRMWVDRLTVF